MFKILLWARNKPGQSAEQFRRYWLEVHAPLAREKLAGLKQYEVNIVTGPSRGEPLVHGVAELYWDTKEAFGAAVSSDVGKQVLNDLSTFTAESAALYVEEHRIL